MNITLNDWRDGDFNIPFFRVQVSYCIYLFIYFFYLLKFKYA